MKALPPAAQDRAIKRVSALILINAMVFQEVLAKKDPRVRPLQFFHGSSDVIVKLSDHWKFILDKINYHPIFHIAHELLSSLTSDADVVKALDHMLATARQIVNCKAALRHDL